MPHKTSLSIETQGQGLGPAAMIANEAHAAYGDPMLPVCRGLKNLIHQITSEIRKEMVTEIRFDEKGSTISACEEYRFLDKDNDVQFYIEYDNSGEHEFDTSMEHDYIESKDAIWRGRAGIEMASADSDRKVRPSVAAMIGKFYEAAAPYAQAHSITFNDDGLTLGLWFKKNNLTHGLLAIHFPGMKDAA